MSTTTDDKPAIGRGLLRLTDFATGSHARAAALLIVVALLAFLPGFSSIPPVDRDEARFAQASKQMLETGDYADIHFQSEVRYKKPVGIYWLQAGVVKAAETFGVPQARTNIWLYRLPSLVGAVGAVLLTYWTALAFVTRRAAVLAALMMGCSLLLSVEARLAKTDAMLLASVLAAMGALARVYLMQRRDPAKIDRRLPAIFWSALAAGVLLKGPVIFLFVGLTIATVSLLDRSLRWLLALRPLVGVLWFALLVLPWFVIILSRAGESFIADSAGKDMLAKIFSSQEGHGAPPGYYFVLYWVTFWPAAMLTGLSAPAVWKARREPGAQFLLAWLIPSWLVFELVITKLPHYVLPLYPAIAILLAGIIESGGVIRHRLEIGLIGWLLYPAAMALLTVVGFVWIGGALGVSAWPSAAAAVIAGLFAWRLYDLDGARHSLLRACLAALLVNVTVFGMLVPSLTGLFPGALIVAQLRDPGCSRPAVAAVGYHEPSLVFLMGTQTRLTDAAGAVEFLRHGECRFAVVESRFERSFAEHAQAAGLFYSPLPRIDAINFSIGRAVSLAVFRSGGAQ